MNLRHHYPNTQVHACNILLTANATVQARKSTDVIAAVKPGLQVLSEGTSNPAAESVHLTVNDSLLDR